MAILDINNLNLTFHNKKKSTQILKDISFRVEEGECLCILGESGSGKSITMKSIMGLLDRNFEISGTAMFGDIDLLSVNKETLRKTRGKTMTMILQNPMVCFDSLYRVGVQIKETFQEHTSWSNAEIYNQSVNILNKMQIRHPEEVLKKYPHQLSGGMLQRIMIGIALALNPKILIADEPTTAIDSITQFEIMKEFIRLKEQKVTMIFITHDLGIASLIADRVLVMNKGCIVDQGSFVEIKENPTNNYTKQLVAKKMAVMASFKSIMGGVQ
ncbi:nickel import ATP-binding protein NikD [Candidatus Epulonipiscium fishelsonii]|uniref:Nickel import ATP-binding protein NikD n=1 Tax=Candidatus Epulonipiscium fishelsonii TaxID=77094 RepID=A0ACC8XE40_9FIRM|nr:nickel import ATP-binding protein NikD [Epulopiscium sp. SCG-D08WGA-EpuloA1]